MDFQVDTVVVTPFYDELLQAALKAEGLQHDDNLLLDNILAGQTYYRKSDFDNGLSDLSYYLTILGSGAAGFAYCNEKVLQGEVMRQLINRNALHVLANETELDFPLKVSLLDAVYSEYNKLNSKRPSAVHKKGGSYEAKADFRSNLVTSHIKPEQRVLLVGLVTEFVRDMVARGIDVSISDMSQELTGTEVYNVPTITEGNDWTLEQLALCDAAIVTGATFSTNTIDRILEVAKARGTELHFYLETGSNFAPQLMQRGATSVVAEHFPFYDLPGETVFEVFES